MINTREIGKLKPTKIMKEKIFITTPRIGFIPQLMMQGPVITPVPITREIAKSMIVSGIKVYRIMPKTKEAILLTLENVYDGEGFHKPDKDDHHKPSEGGVQKPPVPSSGVAPQNPVQPVTLTGVSIPQEEKKEEEEKTTEDITSGETSEQEENVGETAEENKSQNQNNYNKNNKKHKNKK